MITADTATYLVISFLCLALTVGLVFTVLHSPSPRKLDGVDLHIIQTTADAGLEVGCFLAAGEVKRQNIRVNTIRAGLSPRRYAPL